MFTETDDPDEKPKKVKGNAKVKIWSLNPKNPKKKECTVMVDKIREHNKMFVKIIAQKVVKPTIDSLLKGEGTANLLKTPHEKNNWPAGCKELGGTQVWLVSHEV